MLRMFWMLGEPSGLWYLTDDLWITQILCASDGSAGSRNDNFILLPLKRDVLLSLTESLSVRTASKLSVASQGGFRATCCHPAQSLMG